ncbi:protease modulator HflK [Vibrio astriarenae]
MNKNNLTKDIKVVSKEVGKVVKWVAFVVIPTIYLISGFYAVSLEERAIVLRFGKVINDNVLPGMHYRLPWPIEKVVKISTTELQSLTIDYDEESRTKYLQPELVTKNGDLVSVKFDIQYNVSDLNDYVNRTEDTANLIKELSISQAIYYVSQQDFQELLTLGRSDFQSHMQKGLQSKIDSLGVGVNIIGVLITRLDAPRNIKRTFDRVQVAPSEKQKIIQEAIGEQTTDLVLANSIATELLSDANSYSQMVIKKAKGDSGRFIKKLHAMENNPELLLSKEYLDNIHKLLKRVKVKLVDYQ